MDRDPKTGRLLPGHRLGGRPDGYSESVVEQILQEIALGHSLLSICRQPGMPPYATVVSWVTRNQHGFEERYWTARRAQCVHLSEEIISIADEATGGDMAAGNIAKLRCDARKWTLARMDASRWSEAVMHQHAHQIGGSAVTVNLFLPKKGSDMRLVEGSSTVIEDGSDEGC